ncbi:MAG: hypothetical protein CW691_08190 [Candidatus Bathyarchaeum sp.]|nr:MAG: hypothetical protein CW691_08190 [Candidatus Bathyarchaeum sp.]
MILLGAGASNTFGISTLQGMTAELIKFMEKRGHADVIQNIIESQRRFNLTSDFEAIYTIVQAMANPLLGIQKSGPLTAYVCRKDIELKTNTDFEDILKDFNKFIFEECSLKAGFNAAKIVSARA